jgi:hypothetical protein
MCCGNQRQQFHATESAGPGTRLAAGNSADQPRRQTVVYFEYVGPTGLTAVGAGSGARYRFDRQGAIVAVDPMDRRSLLAVPHLRQVAGPW